jgi:DNA-damage-inducible protein J
MAKTATIHAEAINLFLRQVTLRKGLPFDVKIPNRITRETIAKADRGEDLHEYASIDDFFKEMGV